MEPYIVGIIGVLVMLLLFVLRMPVAYAMLLVGFTGFCTISSVFGGLNLLSRSVYSTFANAELGTIPLFIFMGQLAFNAGISKRLYDTAYHFLGHVRGGLAMTTVMACTAFGAVCGSGPATAATMATVGLPEMKRFGYDDELATGCVASGGGMGMIMPPSVVLLVYGVMTEQSIGKLFVAGILPAFLLTALFLLSIYLRCRHKPELAPKGERFGWGARLRSLLGLLDTLVVFVTVMGGMFLGWFTPTEAAAVGCVAVLLVSLIKRQINLRGIMRALDETLRTSCMVLMLITGASVFGTFLAITRIPFTISGWVGSFDLPTVVIMGIIVLIYFLGGCFMDALAMVMLTIPVFFPLVMSLGYDPIWFGVIVVLITGMGVITPPVGINVYVVYGITRQINEKPVALETIFRGIMPFLLASFVGIFLLILFPSIVTCLPAIMG